MRKIQLIGLALVAAFALSAIAASAAVASPEWLCNGAPCAAKTVVESEATLQLSDKTLLGTIKVECSGLSVGTVGAGTADEVTAVLDLTGTTTEVTCTVLEGGNLCTPPAIAKAVNLPWLTTLLSLTEDDLTGSGVGNPGWSIKCANGLSDECTKELAILAVSNEVLEGKGVVDELFNVAENATCKNGTGKVSGLVLVLLAGGSVAVS